MNYSSYYDSLTNIYGADSMQGTGYVQYQRWFDYWAPKIMPDLDYDDYQNNILAYARNYTNGGQSGNSQNKWHLIGPKDIPSQGVYGSAGVGQIHYIYIDQLRRIFACSPVGGLFLSTSQGDTWQNAGTDKGLPRSGVSSVVVDSQHSGVWYVTTGNGESYYQNLIWQQAIGLYRTTDNGKSWELLGLDTVNNQPVQSMRKVIEIAPTENTRLIVTTTNGLYLVTDANTSSWQIEQLIEGEFYDVVSDPSDQDIIYASGSTQTGVYKYDLNSHVSTKLISMDTIPYFKKRRFSLNLIPDAPDYLYAVYSAKDTINHLYRYCISTGNWVNKGEVFGISGYERTLGWTIRPEKNGEGKVSIYGRDVNPMFLYYDDLSNDTITASIKVKYRGSMTHVDYHYLMVEDNNSIIWAGTDGGVYRGVFINDSIIQWEPKSNGLAVNTIEHMDAYYKSYDNLTMLTSGQFDCGSYLYTSYDNMNWDIASKYGGDGYMNDIVNEDKYYLSRQNTMVIYNQNNISVLDSSNVTDCTNPNTLLWPILNWHVRFARSGNTVYGVGPQGVVKSVNNIWQPWSLFTDESLYPEMGCQRSGVYNIIVYGNNTKYISTYGNSGHNYYFYQRIYKQDTENITDWMLVKNQPVTTKWITDIEFLNADNIYVGMRKDNASQAIYKVHATDPGNAGWTGIDYNLPEHIVVSCIEHENDKLWIGTNRGIFYLNDGDNQWVDYTENLPNVEVTDIKVKNKRVYVGTYGRGVWEASAPDCYSSGEVTLSGTIVGQGQTERYYSDIRILPNTTAVIYGTLKMGARARIIVERTAKLIVDGGTITNACPDMWQGIELWGNSNAVQDSLHQGRVILKNGAILEHAERAIATIKRTDNVMDLSYAGGIIEADYAHFKNNTVSVMMHPYPKNYNRFALVDNKSYFKYCTFTYDSTYYYFHDAPVNHVSLDNVFGVLFINNTFENRVSTKFAPQGKRGTGINGWCAGFKAVNDFGVPTGNVFENLDYGIKTNSFYGVNHHILIDHTKFKDNYTGCYLGAETFATVSRNTFDITGMTGQPDNLCGLYLNACTGYQVEENEFYSDYDPQFNPVVTKSYGLVVNSSGPEDNMIYNNNFHNLSWATQAQNQNRSTDGQSGLQIKCNDYYDNYSDISVTWDNQSNMNGIAYNQGSAADTVTAPAGNRFSQLGKWAYSDFDNQGEELWYYLPYTLGLQYKVIPIYSDTSKVKKSINPLIQNWKPTDGCPSHLTGKTKSQLNAAVAAKEAERTVYADSLVILVDDGNTVSLNLDVVTSIPPETMQLRDQLLNASPYLSDTVMMNAAEKEEVLPNSIITEILAENPQSAKAGNVLNALNNRNNPPNANQMAAIMANDTVLGQKERLESKLAYYRSEKHRNVNGLVRLFMQDTTTTAKADSIEAALDNVSTPYAYYLQALARYNKGDSIGVLNKLSDVSSDFDLNTYETEVHEGFEDYFDVMLTLQAQNKAISEIDSTQKTVLYGILQNAHGLVQAFARNILIKTDGLQYREPYILIDTATNKSAEFEKPYYKSNREEESYLKLYPNPAYQYLTVEYQIPLNADDAVLEIITLKGVHIETIRLTAGWGEKIIDFRYYKPGTYLIRIYINGKPVETEKFVKF